MSRGMCTALDIWMYILKLKKVVMNLEQNTQHATRSARNTDRQTGKEECIHTRQRLIKTGKQTRNVCEGDRGYYW